MGCTQSSKQVAVKPEVVSVAQEPQQPDVVKPAPAPALLKVGDKVDVTLDGGFQGEVLRCTTTDVLVKTAEGQERWCEVEDLQTVPTATSPPLQTEVQVGQVINASTGVSGIVVKRTTTEVCLKKDDGELAWVDIEDVTYLKVCIHSSSSVRAPHDASKSDVCCDVQLDGKDGSRVTAAVPFDRVDQDWNFECRIVSYAAGDTLTFTVYDKDLKAKGEGEGALGAVTLAADQISKDGYFGDLQLAEPGTGTVRVHVRVQNAATCPKQPEPTPAVAQQAVVVEERPPAPQKACCW